MHRSHPEDIPIRGRLLHPTRLNQEPNHDRYHCTINQPHRVRALV